jgi:hypothetical protein
MLTSSLNTAHCNDGVKGEVFMLTAKARVREALMLPQQKVVFARFAGLS